jgi:hypothetical protein
MKNYVVLHGGKDERNILHTIKRKKAKWIGHILRRYCLVNHVTEGKTGESRRRGRRPKQLQSVLNETRSSGGPKAEFQGALCGELSLEEAWHMS